MGRRVLHTGDLFLTSPLLGIRDVPDLLAGRLASATFDAWDRFTDVAADVGADLVLVTGGLPTMPPAQISSPLADAHAAAAQVHFAAGLERLAAIGAHVVVVGSLPTGAGPPVPTNWTPPDSVHLSAADQCGSLLLTCRDGSVVSVAVNADPTANANPTPEAGAGDTTIVATVAPSQPGPDVRTDLRPSYWALGGRGEGVTYRPSADGPWFVQAGPTQPHRFPRPRGESGAVLVEMDDDGAVNAVRRLATDAVRLLTIPVDLGKAATVEAMAAALNTQAEAHVASALAADRPVLARAELHGTGATRRLLATPGDRDRLVSELRDGAPDGQFWWADALLSPLPADAVHALTAADPLAAELLRVAGAHDNAPRTLLTEAVSLSLELARSPESSRSPSGAGQA